MARYDWEALKREFLLGDYKSAREFALKKGLRYNSYFRQKTKEWTEEKLTLSRLKHDKVIKGTLEEQVRQEIDWNTRHLEIWGKLLAIILEAVEDYRLQFVSEKTGRLNVYALEKVANIIEKAQKGQRLSLGLDEKTEKDDGSLKELAEAIRESFKSLGDNE